MNYLRDNPNQVFLILDTETSNLSLINGNLPWSVGYILYQNGKILEQYNRFIKWENFKISKDAARITRFNELEYKEKGEDPNLVLNHLEQYLNNKEIVKLIHNGSSFDCYIIKNWREELGRKNDYSYLDETIDTNSLARAIKKGVKKVERKDWKLMSFRFCNYVEKGLKTNLTALGKEFGIEFDYLNLHESLNDCKLLAKIWDRLKFQIEI